MVALYLDWSFQIAIIQASLSISTILQHRSQSASSRLAWMNLRMSGHNVVLGAADERPARAGGRYPDHPHPDSATAARRSEADRDAGGRGDETLAKAIVRAHRWRRRIESGQAKSITDLADQEGVTDAYVCRPLPLTCLAPDIVEAIIAARSRRD
jgi:hypothetical protein